MEYLEAGGIQILAVENTRAALFARKPRQQRVAIATPFRIIKNVQLDLTQAQVKLLAQFDVAVVQGHRSTRVDLGDHRKLGLRYSELVAIV